MKSVLCGTVLFAIFALSGIARAEEFNTCRLILPQVVYAVAGTEVNLYFQNLILTPPGRVWIFDVNCTKGKQQVERWTWLPADEDAGDLPLALEVPHPDDKLVPTAKTPT